MNSISILTPSKLSWYELLDSGNGKKLEKVGPYKLVRPDSQALWNPSLSDREWNNFDAMYTRTSGTYGKWEKKSEIPNTWEIEHEGIKFYLKLTPFGHIGVFPEQEVQWNFIKKIIHQNSQIKILNLFSYTGISTLIAAKANAHVTHVDASKPALSWAVENQKLSDFSQKPIRWLIDDALKFVKREQRRGNTYDGILLDPPKFGRGPKGELWQFEDNFADLLNSCVEILAKNPKFIVVTAYAIPISAITLGRMLEQTMQKFHGTTEFGELGLAEKSSTKLLPTSLFARWS